MTRCAAGLLFGLCAGLWPALAWPAVSVSMTRSVEGLDQNGFLPQGTTHVDFVVRLATEGNPAEISALAIEERLPLNFAYASLDGDQRPDVVRFDPATGLLQFAWITPPATFPVTLRYRVNILQTSGETLQVSGHATYRADAGELRTDDVVTELVLAPCLNFNRISAEGCYSAGTPHDIEVSFDSNCVGAVTALRLLDRLYNGMTFAGVSGPFAPDTADFNAETGTLDLSWIQTPAFPFSFIYTVNVPAGATGDISISGRASYVQAGEQQQTPERVTLLCGEDLTPPVITLLGSATMTTECGQPFIDPGATASDNIDGDLTQDIVRSGEVDTSTPGQYQIRYTVSDREGNAAIPQTRTVIVEDRTAPVIILRGASTVQVECHETYNEAGVTANDLCEGDLTGAVVATGTVNTEVPGLYTRTYNVSDSAGNAAEPVTRQVQVVDTTRPVITLLGSPSITVQCGTSFTDPGATAADVCVGDLTEEVQVAGIVDVEAPGAYTLTYTVEDTSLNAALPVTRRVLVVDTTPPQITLLGDTSVTIECGSVYTDAGATAADSCAGDLTNALARTSTLNVREPGQYTVTYNVTDGSGNAAAPVTRTVLVRDTQPPVLRLIGNAVISVSFGTGYTDPGATATDACDGSLTASIAMDNPVNPNQVGRYVVRYTVQDAEGNAAAPLTREVNVVDTVRPVIALLGDGQITLDCGSGPFQDPGATATDNADGDLTAEIVVRGQVNTETPGEYNLEYTVRDSSGNEALPVVRRVTVRNTPARVTGVNILSPRGSVIIPQGRTVAQVTFNTALVLAQPVGCPEGIVEMTYLLGGQPVGTSRDRARNFPLTVDLPLGTHTLTASARTLATNAVAASAPLQIRVAAGTDSDANGIVDNPFAALNQEGDLWASTAQEGGCPRGTQMVTWFGDCGAPNDARVNLTVAVPGDPTQAISVSAPRRLVNCNQQGILLVSIACDLEGLFNAQQAQVFEPLPPAMVAGGSFFEVSLLVSSDNGQSFSEVSDAQVEAFPVSLSLSGLAFNEEEEATFFRHPTSVHTDPVSGVQVQAAEGEWSSDFVDQVAVEGGVLNARSARLSTFGPFAVSTTGPLLSVEPVVGGQFLIGGATVGQFIDGTLTVRNIGTGRLQGSAQIVNNPAGAFSIVSGPNYDLDPDESQEIRVRFAPGEVAVYNGTIQFTGNPSGPVSVQLRGTGNAANKPFTFLGCGTREAEGGAWADLAVVLSLIGLLGLGQRRGRKT